MDQVGNDYTKHLVQNESFSGTLAVVQGQVLCSSCDHACTRASPLLDLGSVVVFLVYTTTTLRWT